MSDEAEQAAYWQETVMPSLRLGLAQAFLKRNESMAAAFPLRFLGRFLLEQAEVSSSALPLSDGHVRPTSAACTTSSSLTRRRGAFLSNFVGHVGSIRPSSRRQGGNNGFLQPRDSKCGRAADWAARDRRSLLSRQNSVLRCRPLCQSVCCPLHLLVELAEH